MTTEATTTETTETETTTETEQVTDWQAEAEKWRGLADKSDKRAKRLEDTANANAKAAKELEALRQSTMSETEKAVAQARAEARAEAIREVASDRVADKFRALANGRPVKIDTLLEGIDPGRFITSDGTPDTKAIESYLNELVPAADDRVKRDLGLGARGQQAPALNSDPLLGALKSKLGIP